MKRAETESPAALEPITAAADVYRVGSTALALRAPNKRIPPRCILFLLFGLVENEYVRGERDKGGGEEEKEGMTCTV